MILKKILFFLVLFFTSSSLICGETEPLPIEESPKLNEAFIMMTVTSNRGNSFYRVLVDDKENPYLDIEDILSNYFDLTDVKCNFSRQYCQGTMQPSKNIFWIDGKNLRYGDYEDGSGKEPLPDEAFVVQEGKCWLKYDAWGKWLPLTSSWDLRSYYLSVIPEFKLLSDRLRMREQEKERAEAFKKQRDIIDKTEAIEPTDKFRPEFKYHASFRKRPQQSIGADFNYDLNVDVLKGTFQTGGPVTYDDKEVRAQRPYWTYRWKKKSWFDLMEFGNSTFEEAALMLPNVTANNSFRFDSREIIYGAGNISINERAIPNAQVDIYRDGIYLGTTIAGPDGRYIFNNIAVDGQSRVVAKIYYPDGSEEIKEIVLSDDNGMILDAGKFEERVFTGETLYGRLNYLALRYGLLDEATIGVSPIKFPGTDKASFMADLAMRPFPSISFLGQGLFTGNNIDRSFRVNTTLLYPNFIQIEHRYYNQDTPVFLRNFRELGEYWAVRHSLGIGRLQFLNDYEQDVKMKTFGAEVIYNFSRYFKPFVEYRITFPKFSDDVSSTRTGIDFILGDNTVFEAVRTWMKPYSINSLSLILRDPYASRGWNITASFNIPDKKIKGSFVADIAYRITRNITVGVLAQDKYFGFHLDLDGLLTPSPGPEIWSEFGTGTLAGTVMSPAEKDKEPYPIQGAYVLAGSRSAVTDENGKFLISAIAPYEKFMAKIEPNSLDASVLPEKEFEVVQFRPGTAIEWNPKLVWTAGVDGVLLGDEEFSPDLFVEAVRITDGVVIGKGKVESDGFFIIEKLTTGTYQLRLKGYKKDIPSITLNIPEGEDWVSGLTWNLGDVNENIMEIKVPKFKLDGKVMTKKELSFGLKESRYYSIGGKPLYIAQIKEPLRAIEGRLVGKKISRGLKVEAVRLKDGKIQSTGKVSRDGSFVIDKLIAGEYELRLKGTDSPPVPLKVILDDEDVLSGVRWEW